jgi:histone deacetylase 1/2
VFDGLFDFCRLYTGASLDGAVRLNHGQSDVAINWSGGLHHAKKAQASGFCYINDLVLAILELLKMHARVLYVDIDIHHGDGVEEAFYLSDRVMTVSFHQYGSYVFGNDTHVFFPGSGALEDVGEKRGKFYSLNVPLSAGATDSTFHSLFKPIMTKVVEVFNPTAIVLQSGADSLANDRLGGFNLTVDGHGEAVNFMKKFKLPMLVTGGGGYTKNNVARCWTNETAILVGEHLAEELPPNAYAEYYQPHNRLDRAVLSRKPLDNYNTRARIDEIRERCMEYLRHLAHTPAVQMHYAPRANTLPEWDLEDEGDPDERMAQYARDHRLMEDYLHDYKQLDDDLAAAARFG